MRELLAQTFSQFCGNDVGIDAGLDFIRELLEASIEEVVVGGGGIKGVAHRVDRTGEETVETLAFISDE